jgi:hypothetical protein
MRVLVAIIACLGVGCAAAASNTPVTVFQASDLELFDNAVDLVEVPVIVEGDWSGAFERRVQRADLVAVVRIDSLSNDFVSRRSAYRLIVRVKKRLKGSSTKELVLRVGEEEAGYETVQVNEDRLLHNPFVAFIKWEADQESDDLIAHWHLSPDSDEVRDKVDYSLRQPAQQTQAQVQSVSAGTNPDVTSAPAAD